MTTDIEARLLEEIEAAQKQRRDVRISQPNAWAILTVLSDLRAEVKRAKAEGLREASSIASRESSDPDVRGIEDDPHEIWASACECVATKLDVAALDAEHTALENGGDGDER